MVCSMHAQSLTDEFLQMSDKQVESLTFAHNQGGYTLAAIAWTESHAGKVRINLNVGSVDLGLFMLNSKSFLERWYKAHPDKTRSHYYDNILLSRVMTDDSLSSIYAQKELDYWKTMRNRNIRDTIKSYNCGSNIQRHRCDKYFRKVWDRRKVLIQHLQVENYWYKDRP